MQKQGLCWENCIGMCMDCAGALQERKKQKTLHVIPHVRFSRMKALATKMLDLELNDVLQTKIVNHIQHQMFLTSLSGNRPEYESVLFHSEVGCLSRAEELIHLFEMNDVMDDAHLPVRHSFLSYLEPH